MSCVSTPQRFFFVHLQKTAGTALFIRMRAHFGEQAVYPMPEYEQDVNTSFLVDLMVERFQAHRDEIQVVVGHFPLAAADLLDVPTTCFTVLRDPVQRVVSSLREQRARAPQFRTASWEAIYDDPWRREWLLTNHMARMLGQSVEELRASQVGPDDLNLERAKVALVERIDLFGFQEQFDEFCTRLAARYGWDLGETVVANASPPAEVPERLLERIRTDNWADVELYAFAQALAGREHG
jgi:Galactose-3-O-sulfotransferase